MLLARFEDLIGAGLRHLIEPDANLRIVAADIDVDRLDGLIVEQEPRVMILNLSALSGPAEIRRR